MTVSDDFPEDVQILYRALKTLHNTKQHYTTLNLSNCGTAMRFLTAYAAQLENRVTILDGVERMHHRPIGQLVDALREMGAQIEYLGEEGYPPLRIKGCALDKHRIMMLNNPQSTQFVSALLLIGANVQTNSTSPYIHITREIISEYQHAIPLIEKDWSSAAFWYEYIALKGGNIELKGLTKQSVQGDKVVADIFQQLGVYTEYLKDGVRITKVGSTTNKKMDIDFSACPDLYPAVALTCERLGITLHATGTGALPLKESDRLRAVREHRTDHDHRMAMALLVAGYPVDDTDCIAKSYPQFMEQWRVVCSQDR